VEYGIFREINEIREIQMIKCLVATSPFIFLLGYFLIPGCCDPVLNPLVYGLPDILEKRLLLGLEQSLRSSCLKSTTITVFSFNKRFKRLDNKILARVRIYLTL
jgi:hypothetical protein